MAKEIPLTQGYVAVVDDESAANGSSSSLPVATAPAMPASSTTTAAIRSGCARRSTDESCPLFT